MDDDGRSVRIEQPCRSAHGDARGEDVVLASALGVDCDIRQIAHVIGVVYVGIGIARGPRIEMTASALEIRTFASARRVNVHSVHARRGILDTQNDLNHTAVAAVGDLVQRRSARETVLPLYCGACGLHRRSAAALTLCEGGIRGWRRGIL